MTSGDDANYLVSRAHATRGRLLEVRTCAGEAPREFIGQPCHEALMVRPVPCAGCPVPEVDGAGSERVAVIEADADDGTLLLVTARAAGVHAIAVTRRRISERSVGALVAARIDRLATAAGLSPRQKRVLELLVLGRTLKDVGLVLGITARTAKYHQQNVLEKLGADSRVDLVRIVLGPA